MRKYINISELQRKLDNEISDLNVIAIVLPSDNGINVRVSYIDVIRKEAFAWLSYTSEEIELCDMEISKIIRKDLIKKWAELLKRKEELI